MPRPKKAEDSRRNIDTYIHDDKDRVNNPPAGLVTPQTDPDSGKKTYQYDPHLDPQLQWAGKAERTSFDVPTVSLHVHERIDPKTIIQAVKKKNGIGSQPSLFEQQERPLREEIEFYKHRNGWTNRLVAGDSLLVMNSLLEKEGMAGQVQMIYIDPPYGIKYGSNFQPFVNKRDVKDGKDEDLTAEPETIKAFRDTWELGIHSYLAYLRDRLLLARELLHESGSCFVQISDENVHLVRCLMDEVFGMENFVSLIAFRKTGSISSKTIGTICDFMILYSKCKDKIKFKKLYTPKNLHDDDQYNRIIFPDGTNRTLSLDERQNPNLIPVGAKVYQPTSLQSDGKSINIDYKFEFDNQIYEPNPKSHWKTSLDGLGRLAERGRIIKTGNTIRYVRYFDDFPFVEHTNVWNDVYSASTMRYVVQTSELVIQRCLLMTTDPGDLVLDLTCGSGTTAFVAEQWGRRWLTCDTSRVAIALAKQRLMTAVFDYYQLAHPAEGVGSGFRYKTVPHITLKSIANNEPPAEETLYDQPYVEKGKARVTGPFTVEAVPAPLVKPLDDIDLPPVADASVARSGQTLRQHDWQHELLRTGIRGKDGQRIQFTSLEPLAAFRYLHALGETKADEPQVVAVSFGPEFAPLEQRQVEMALEEARKLKPSPALVVFAAFQFDPEAAKDIDEMNWPGVTLLKVQMNADLLTDDLKKKRSSNESFWLIGQPDVLLTVIAEGEDGGKYCVEVQGFDYYDTRTGAIVSGNASKIATWLLDTDYDGRSVFPHQVFFPMAGSGEGWSKLARNLKAEIDEDLIESYHGTQSLPFAAGEYRRIAVKIIDDRGIESLKVLDLPH